MPWITVISLNLKKKKKLFILKGYNLQFVLEKTLNIGYNLKDTIFGG